MNTLIRTPRFEIHRHVIQRSESLGGKPRAVYQAWFHSQDVAYPVCIVTLWEEWTDFVPKEERTSFVEWIHVEEEFRRQGIATEVLGWIEATVGPLTMNGATDEGEAFCEFFYSKVGES